MLKGRHTGRYVLIGGPGQGKTTLGQYVCQVFRAALLKEVDPDRLEADASAAVEQILEQEQHQKISSPKARRFPFRVVLSEFASALADKDSGSLLEYLSQKFNSRTSGTLTPNELLALLVEHPCILVLDGLDEVPASSNRDSVLVAVRDFLVDVTTAQADFLVVATSRPQGYNQDFSPRSYEHRWLVPLTPDRALAYGKRLTGIRFAGDSYRINKVIGRLQRALKTTATARLMRSPLQVTILTLLVDRMGQPPQERWALFKEYYNLIYQRETERDIPAAAILRDYRSDIDTIHQQVGLVLQVESEKSGGTDARLTNDQFASIVDQYLRAEGHEEPALSDIKGKLIESAANRLVFLVGLQEGRIGFEIRSLQEFMAAEGIMAAEDATVQNRLRAIAPVSSWRNVFLFAAGKCFADRKHLRDTIESICLELNDTPEEEIDRFLYSGSVLALELLEDGPAARQPAKLRALTRLALKLLSGSSLELGDRLASIYQPETRDIFDQEMAEREDHAVAACIAGLSQEKGCLLAGYQLDKMRNQLRTDDSFFLWMAGRVASAPSQFLIDEVAEAARHHSPARLMIALSNHAVRTDYDDNQKSVVWPAWWDALQVLAESRFSGPRPPVPVLDSSGNEIGRINLVPVNGPAQGKASALLEIDPANNDWLPYLELVKFIDRPSVPTLRAALTSILDRLRAGELDDTYMLMSLAPWPLRLCVRDFEAEQLEEILDCASEESLGSAESWEATERRWLSNGIGLTSLLNTNVELVDGGILPSLVGKENFIDLFTDSTDQVAAMSFEMEPGKERDFLLRSIAYELIRRHLDVYPTERDDKRNRPTWIDRLVQGVFAMHDDWYLATDLVDRYGVVHISDPNWRTALCEAPLNSIPYFFGSLREPAEMRKLILKTWQANLNSPELLPALAFGAQSPRFPRAVLRRALDVVPTTEDEQVALLVVAAGCRALAPYHDKLAGAVRDDPILMDALLAAAVASSAKLGVQIKSTVDIHQIAMEIGNVDSSYARLKSLGARRRSDLVWRTHWLELAFPAALFEISQGPNPH